MGSHRLVNIPIGIAIYLTVLLPFVVAVAGYSSSQSRWKHKEQYGNVSEVTQPRGRDPKFFPLLGFVTLPASTCVSDDGRLGACMKRKTCQRQGGMALGSCAMNFGVCCVLNKVCSGNGSTDVVTLNGTHLLQPAMFSELCRYEIPRQPGVCQIRLDFNEFKIKGPVTIDDNDPVHEGDCATDLFSVSGASNAMLGPLCGDLKGQHMYLDYGNSDKINLDFFLQSAMMQQWDITVTMIRCDSSEKAPPGCLQYYTAQTGLVKSFNWNNMSQINNQDYSVCVRTNIGMRKITWKPCNSNPSMTTDFVISGDQPGPGIGFQVSGNECTTDWVMILGANKFCGSKFPDSVPAMTQPFILEVHFNEYEVPPLPPLDPSADPSAPIMFPEFPPLDSRNSGFCLKYTQSPF